MSRITNVILTSYGDNADLYIEDYVTALNDHCFGDDKAGFKPVDLAGSSDTGGSKFMVGCILLGGFNYLNLSEFIKNLKSFDWEGFSQKHNKPRPYSVDLFYLVEDEENGYTYYPIYRR
jgi:hypothetical protein